MRGRAMRYLLACASVLVAQTAIADIDYTCMSRCQALNYQYHYCQEICTYNAAPAPPLPPPGGYYPNASQTDAAIARGVPGIDLSGTRLQIAAMMQQQQQMQAQQAQMESQRRLIDEQTRAPKFENERRGAGPNQSYSIVGPAAAGLAGHWIDKSQAFDSCMRANSRDFCERTYLSPNDPRRTQQSAGQVSSAAPQPGQSGGTGSQYSEADKAIYMRWLQAAEPRRRNFPDFDSVVFAPDVITTMPMIDLMAGSPYAADIAYYLATHKAESFKIANMSLLDQAVAIKEIERNVIASGH